MSETLGAYIQVYKNNGYPEFALGHFRKHYPNSPIYMVSDNGHDFSSLAKSINAKYDHSSVNVGVSQSGYSIDDIKEWLKRMERCFMYCDTKYVIYLEDDVFVRTKINIDETHKISGYNGNLIPNGIIDYFERKYPMTEFNSMRYGACGGTIYNRENFLENLRFFHDVISDNFTHVKNNISRVFGFFDCTMTVLYMLAGCKYDINKELIGTGNFPDWKSLSQSIVHIQKIMANDPVQDNIMKEFPV